MPNISVEEKEDNQIKITFTLTPDEVQPFLEDAAEKLSETTSIPGFRPGKAGFEIVKQRFGETKIMEDALESIVRRMYVKAILDKEIDTIGSPKINVEKMAPGNDLVFTAEATRMPRVIHLTDFHKLSLESRTPVVEEKEIDLALKDLTRMQTKEVRAGSDSIVNDKNKVVLAMNIKKDGVAIEGGQSLNHAIYLPEDYYIPGFKDQIIGMKEGETKTFTLPFPKEHVQEFLAGRDVDFEIELKEIFHLEPPSFDDSFATSLGIKDFQTMKDLIRKNLLIEKLQAESLRQEKETLELIANKTQIENIPNLLLNEELEKMIHELKHRVEEQGMEFEKYIMSLKKTLPQIKIDFTPQALMRIRVAIILKEIAKQENVSVTNEELDKELDEIASRYEDAEAKKQIYTPDYRQYIEHIATNRKVIDLVKKVVVK